MSDIKSISFNGETLNTKFYKEVSSLQMEMIVEDYYSKPNLSEVRRNIHKLNDDGVMKTKINDYFFKELYSKVKLNHSKWSIEDVLSSRELLGFVNGKIDSNEKVYPNKEFNIKNVETVFRIGSKGIAQKPSMFPVKVIRDLLIEFNVINYHDYACGWGDRLVGSLSAGSNYYGTDVNPLLTKELHSLTHIWKEETLNSNTVDIRTQGSEVFISEWEGIMDFSFSSPPYFDLEDYKLGVQSWSKGVSFDRWIIDYLEPTIYNSVRYLRVGGVFGININNTKQHDLVTEAYEICINSGLRYMETRSLKNIKRIKSDGTLFDNGESIMLFVREEVCE